MSGPAWTRTKMTLLTVEVSLIYTSSIIKLYPEKNRKDSYMSTALPMSYFPHVGREGENRTPYTRIPKWSMSYLHFWNALPPGLDPGTPRVTTECSANWAIGDYVITYSITEDSLCQARPWPDLNRRQKFSCVTGKRELQTSPQGHILLCVQSTTSLLKMQLTESYPQTVSIRLLRREKPRY